MKTFTFHISHGPWSADLQLTANHTLYELAETIIKAVGFDLDHCFGFYNNLERVTPSSEEYTLFADLGEEANAHDPGVENTLLDQVFEPRKPLLFLFDYGDAWRFLVTCTSEENHRAFKRPKILTTTGTPPVQYSYPNEEEEETPPSGAIYAIPHFTPAAMKRWLRMTEKSREAIITTIWCSTCNDSHGISKAKGKLHPSGDIMLEGLCPKCGGPVARVIETGETQGRADESP
ncbi:MAG: IS1096 element passenger TnpR family protein [Verrucomicrobiota bacterium JB025]|nr:hypothetical protein [Verrucomicrobiota bacterium JB025]